MQLLTSIGLNAVMSLICIGQPLAIAELMSIASWKKLAFVALFAVQSLKRASLQNASLRAMSGIQWLFAMFAESEQDQLLAATAESPR